MGRRVLETVQGNAHCLSRHTWRAIRKTIQKTTPRTVKPFKAVTTQQVKPDKCPTCGEVWSIFDYED